MPKKETNTFSHFFKEDAEIIQDVLKKEASKQQPDAVGLVKKETFPRIKKPIEISEDELKVQWQKLRSFFRYGNNTNGLSDDLTPVILSPSYTHNIIGSDFPVWMAGEKMDDGEPVCLSLKEVLTKAIGTNGENNNSILEKNIERILHIANIHLEDKKPKHFHPAIHDILDELESQLEISGDESQVFKNDLKHLKNALPEGGILLPYSINTSFQLLEAAMDSTLYPIRKSLEHNIDDIVSKLNDLLRVERDKGPDRKDPKPLQESLSFVDSMVKFDKLSSLLPEAGSESMGSERISRINNVVKEIEENKSILEQKGFVFVDELLYNNEHLDWKNLFVNADIQIYKEGEGSDVINSKFHQHIHNYTKFIVAKRIGELELENKYQPDIHNEYFENFDWQSFTSEELNNCGHFILIVDDVQLFGTEFSKLSSMLSDNIPIKIVAVKRDDQIDHQEDSNENIIHSLHSQAELGALMLSHRNIYVAQSTSITPIQLFQNFQKGLNAFAPAFFYVLNVDEEIHQNPYLWTSATIESRDFPGFTFEGLLGTPWGSRFDIGNNPQPNLKWPVHQLHIIDEEDKQKTMEFPFTFADKAMLNPLYHRYFLPVDSSFWSENLIPLINYLENSQEENIGKVPFIWIIDMENNLQKVAISWPIVIATQERLDFWRFLQENSGINNFHVTQAVETVKAEMKAVHEYEIEQLKGKQNIEIENIRKEEAGNVMENLTNVLLNLEPTAVVNSIPTPSDIETSHTSPEPVEMITEDIPKDIEEVKEVESLLTNEAYIETPLCTTCDECTDINREMFKYNEDKLAYIADPTAGTFKQLVEAAEMCPVAIIHPGSPLNPNEENLEDLIKRAQDYNS